MKSYGFAQLLGVSDIESNGKPKLNQKGSTTIKIKIIWLVHLLERWKIKDTDDKE